MSLITTTELIAQLGLLTHPEGGYFVVTDEQEEKIPSPFAGGALRSLATSIYYMLSFDNAKGVIHMNKSVTYHVLHQGRAIYTLITPGSPPRIARKVMGTDVAAGETRMLLVGTGVWKMSQLLPEDLEAAKTEEQKNKTNCLITEVVTPGFHWEDHKYLTKDTLRELFGGTEGGAARIEEFSEFVKEK